jgi:beta-xylosidase
MADPDAVWAGDAYYAYGTDGPEGVVRQRTGRVFPVLRSEDLVHWEFVGGALAPPVGKEEAEYWAPEVVPFEGRFAMVYSYGGLPGEPHRLRLAFADRPEGPFEDTGIVYFPDEPFSIDGHLFRDPADGRWTLFFAKDYLEGERPGTAIAAVRLTDDLRAVDGEPVTIQRAAGDWQIFERNRFLYEREWPAWYTVEGPFVVFHEGRYHLFTSGGLWAGADYGVLVTSSENVLGPYDVVDAHLGPNMLRGAASGLRGAGHNSVVVGPDGRHWIVFHAWDEGITTRQMYVQPLEWVDGRPRLA